MDGNELLKVYVSDDGSKYQFNVAAGTNAHELAFVISALLKVLERDGVIERNEMMALITKYSVDPQYDEVKS